MNHRSGGIESVLITERLNRRNPRRPQLRGEHRAFAALARELKRDPAQAPQKLVKVALDLCQADSAGISVLRPVPNDDYLYWSAVAGQLAPHADVVTPRNFSPCGTALDINSVQLFYCPGRVFTYLNGLSRAPVVELLVAPISSGNHALGTLWVASHDPPPGRRNAVARQFDAGDLRIAVGLAELTVTALQRVMALSPSIRGMPDGGQDPGRTSRLKSWWPAARRLASSLRLFSS